MKRTWSRLLVTGALAATVVMGAPGVASADSTTTAVRDTSADSVTTAGWPTGCDFGKTGWPNNTSWAKCNRSNGGHYRARIQCLGYDGQYVDRVGEWRSSGYSFATCPPRTGYHAAGIESKAS